MQKHTYTHEEAPMNTGSVKRPARLDLRQTCEDHARTHRIFQKIRERTKMKSDAAYAEVWSEKILLALEHIEWHLKNSSKPVQHLMMSLFEPLPQH